MLGLSGSIGAYIYIYYMCVLYSIHMETGSAGITRGGRKGRLTKKNDGDAEEQRSRGGKRE